MTIPGIEAIASSIGASVASQTSAASSAAAPGAGFGDALARGMEQLQQLQSTADGLAVQAATGQLKDVHQYMVASTEAQLATQLTVAVRNKALEAFNSIMHMQV